MSRTIIALAVFLTAASAAAQTVEIAPFIGYKTSGSADTDRGLEISQISVEGDLSYGAMIDFMLGNTGFEFLWSHQPTVLTATLIGEGEVELFDINSDQFLFNFIYEFGEPNAPIQPFVLGGLGWTHFSPQDVDVSGQNKFAFDFGVGVKSYFTENIGVRVDARYTPTYVTSTDDFFCDPFVCYAVPNSHYFNQFEFTGALTFKF